MIPVQNVMRIRPVAFKLIQNLILLTKETNDKGKYVFKKRQLLEILAGVNSQLGGVHVLKITLFGC